MITDEALFDKLEQCAVSSSISANVTMILLDIQQMSISKEVHVGAGDYISLLD